MSVLDGIEIEIEMEMEMGSFGELLCFVEGD